MLHRSLSFILCLLALSISMETFADPSAPAPPPSMIMRAWQKVSNPWGATPTPQTPPISTGISHMANPQAAGCACSAQTPGMFANTLANIGRARDALYDYADKAYHWFRPGITPGPEWAKSCQMFVQGDGSYGPYGHALSTVLSPQTHPNLFNNVSDDMTRFCPAFKTWNDAEGIEKKKMFWVWLSAAVAFSESSCNQNTPEKRGPGGILKGLFQLAKGQEDTFPINAPASYHCSRNSSLTATGSGVCFLKMMNFFVGVHHSIFNAPKDPDRYWQTLFTSADGNVVRSRLKSFTPCQLK